MIETKTKTRQYLTFFLNEEEYAIDVNQIREIVEITDITKIPCTYDYMRGVINIRGNVVPVIDLHMKFELREIEKTIDNCIIVIEVKKEDKIIILGILTDSVEEVINLEEEQIEPPPRIGTKINEEFIKGMGKNNDRFLILLDINKVFSENELFNMEGAAEIKEKENID
jgi:purine-binding chemotaxis protein CheW